MTRSSGQSHLRRQHQFLLAVDFLFGIPGTVQERLRDVPAETPQAVAPDA